MQGGFQNPPVGNQGVLTRPAVKSPNFIHNVSGWSINRDGSAEFNNLTLRGTFIISGSTGEFIYDNAGNLRAADVGQVTTDPVHHITCQQGFSTFNGHGATISLNATALDAWLFYADTGTSTQGALIASDASNIGTDPFGNPFDQGRTNYAAGLFFAQLNSGALGLGSLNAATRIQTAASLALLDALTDSQQPAAFLLAPATASANSAALLVFGSSKDNTKPAQTLIALTTAGTPITGAMLEIEAGAGQVVLELIPTAAGNVVLATRLTGDTVDRLSADGNGQLSWSSGAATADAQLHRLAANSMSFKTCDLSVETLGRGFRAREGANCKQGTTTLAGGTALVANSAVTANSRIFLTAQDNNSTGALRVSGRVAGTSFSISSSNAGDSGVVAFEIFEPA